MKNNFRFIRTLVLIIPLSFGCTVDGSAEGPSGGPDAGSDNVGLCTPSNMQTTLIARRCAGCHNATEPAAGLDLASPGLGDRLANLPSGACADEVIVVAGNPSASYLMQKISGAPTCGEQMPKGGPPLSLEEQGCIESWIQDLQIGGGSTDGSGTGNTGGGDTGGGDTGGGGTGGGGTGGGGGGGW